MPHLLGLHVHLPHHPDHHIRRPVCTLLSQTAEKGQETGDPGAVWQRAAARVHSRRRRPALFPARSVAHSVVVGRETGSSPAGGADFWQRRQWPEDQVHPQHRRRNGLQEGRGQRQRRVRHQLRRGAES